MESSDKRGLIIFLVVVIGVIILWKGNEIGDFQNSDRTDAVLLPFLYLCSLISIFMLIRRRIKGQNFKYRIFTIICVLLIAVLPTYVISGAIKYVDYYAASQNWKLIKGVIVGKSEHNYQRAHTIYHYTIRSFNTTMRFWSQRDYQVGQELHLKLCKTPLGIAVANVE